MPELIDRDKLKTAICIACSNGVIEIEGCASDDCTLQRLIDDQPTIEPEVRHGRWLNTDETVWDAKDIDGKQQLVISIVSARCSVCNHWAEHVNNFPPYMKYEFCPHCGAKMDGGAENG